MTPELRSARGGTLVLGGGFAGAYVAATVGLDPRALAARNATIAGVLSGRTVAALDGAGELHAG